MTLSACGGGGGGGSPAAPPPPPVANANPNTPVLSSSIAMAYTSQGILFTGSATDPNNLPLTYAWDFGDGSTGSGGNTSHSYIGAGVYTVSLTVRNSNGGTASGTISQSIQLKAADTLAIDCVGPSCAARNATTYSGSGTGQWRYLNSTASDATININIAGVSQGNTVTLLFSNGNNASVSTTPGVGILAEPLASTGAPVRADALTPPGDTSTLNAEDAAHSRLLEMNHALKQGMLSANGTLSTTAALADTLPLPSQPSPSPALNTQRTWNDLFTGTAIPYSTTAQGICPVPDGRNVVIWIDPNAQNAGKVSAATVTAFANSFCGTNGGYSRLATLLGDAWGATQISYIIPDTPLQDINIVIVDAPASTGWAGYFFGGNNFKAGASPNFQPNSNEALVFFINANAVQSNLNYTLSTLIHEATHMINFYQRFVLHNLSHDTWLEETTAMMSEDIVSPTVIKNANGVGVNKIAEFRLPSYVQTGGNVSYVNWPSLSSPNYALGGAFGAYLSRRYGLSIYTQLVTTNCNDPVGTNGNSYTCLDSLIKAKGGLGFADEFAHFGASIFAVLPPPAAPSFYGYPAKADGGYSLNAIDVSSFANLRPLTATALSSGYTATTHTYKLDTIAAGKTSYVRNGVVVPANTTLLMVIK